MKKKNYSYCDCLAVAGKLASTMPNPPCTGEIKMLAHSLHTCEDAYRVLHEHCNKTDR